MHHHFLPSNCERRVRIWGPRGLVMLLVLGLSATVLEAQSLADVARQEAERREAIRTEAEVYTNRDLGTAAIRPPAPPTAAAESAPEVADEPEPQEPEEVRDEQYWRDRIRLAREGLARAEILQSALESRINALQTDFVNRDDPAQKAVIAQDRQKAIDEMARTTVDIDQLKKEITDIQEEARKAGAPPGWVR